MERKKGRSKRGLIHELISTLTRPRHGGRGRGCRCLQAVAEFGRRRPSAFLSGPRHLTIAKRETGQELPMNESGKKGQETAIRQPCKHQNPNLSPPDRRKTFNIKNRTKKSRTANRSRRPRIEFPTRLLPKILEAGANQERTSDLHEHEEAAKKAQERKKERFAPRFAGCGAAATAW
jgi:hypothetical protein